MSLSGAIASSSAGRPRRTSNPTRPRMDSAGETNKTKELKEKAKQKKPSKQESNDSGTNGGGGSKSSCILMVALAVFYLVSSILTWHDHSGSPAG